MSRDDAFPLHGAVIKKDKERLLAERVLSDLQSQHAALLTQSQTLRDRISALEHKREGERTRRLTPAILKGSLLTSSRNHERGITAQLDQLMSEAADLQHTITDIERALHEARETLARTMAALETLAAEKQRWEKSRRDAKLAAQDEELSELASHSHHKPLQSPSGPSSVRS